MTTISPCKLIAAAAILSGSLMLAGCGQQNSATAPQSTPPEVGIITVQPARTVLTTELPGRVSPHLIAEVRPQVGGIIQKRLFTEGTDVKAGEVLYQIDPATYRADYASAKAALCPGRGQSGAGPPQGRALPGSGQDQGGQPAGI